MKHYFNIILIAVFLLASRQSFSQEDTSFFKLTSAYKQSWYGGFSLQHGTDHVLNITFLKDLSIRFDSLWISPDSCIALNCQGMTSAFKFKTGDAITLNARELSFAHDVRADQYKIIRHPCPVDFTGDAVIRFYVKRKACYYTVSGIKTLVPIAYP